MPIHVIRHFRFCMDNPTPLSIYSSALPSPPFYKVPLPSYWILSHSKELYHLGLYSLYSYPFNHVALQIFSLITLFATTTTKNSATIFIFTNSPIHFCANVQIQAFSPITFFPQQGQSCLYLYWYALFSLSLFILFSKCSQCNLMFKHIIYYIFKCHFM